MNASQFENFLDEDLAWRKKEISDLLLIAKQSSVEVVLKSLLLLLYAHWEGYIKKSSKLYIKYISEQKIKTSELCENFKALSLKDNISRCIETKDSLTLANEIAFINKYLKYQDKKFKIGIDIDSDEKSDIIDTEANLKPKVFKNIILILGLQYKNALATREHYINSNLLANRNTIGHGSKFDTTKQSDFSLTLKDLEKLKEFIFTIIDNFRDELLEYTDKQYYLNSKQPERNAFEVLKEEALEKVIAGIESKYKSVP